MGAVNSKNVFVGAPDQATTGAILTGEETDIIPEHIDDFVWDDLDSSGYVNEEGVMITPTESTESIKDWSLKVIRKILTEFDATIAWSHLELSADAARNYFGDDNVIVKEATESTGTQTRMTLTGSGRPVKAWYFKIKDGPRRMVILVPHGQVSERGEIPLVASGPVLLPVTLATYPDTAGNSIYIYTDDGVVAGAAPVPDPDPEDPENP